MIQNTGLYLYPPICYTRLEQGIQDTEYRVINVSSFMLILDYSRVSRIQDTEYMVIIAVKLFLCTALLTKNETVKTT